MMYTQTDTDAADDQKREAMAMMVVAVAEPLSLPFSLLATLPPPPPLLLLLLGRPNHEHAAVWLRPQGKREERKAMRSEGARDGSQCYCRRVCTADTANHETVSGVSGRGGGGVLTLSHSFSPIVTLSLTVHQIRHTHTTHTPELVLAATGESRQLIDISALLPLC